jgi:hypothetical protein
MGEKNAAAAGIRLDSSFVASNYTEQLMLLVATTTTTTAMPLEQCV